MSSVMQSQQLSAGVPLLHGQSGGAMPLSKPPTIQTNPRKTVKCLKCKKMVSLQEHAVLLLECEELYRKGAEFMDKEDTQSAIDKFVEGIDLFYTIAIPPHKNTHIAQESLKSCYADQGTVVSVI